jgi:flavin-dependent dehydrogenase
VLLIDRADFPSDTISTHFLHPRCTSYLQSWGLLDRVLAATPSWSEVIQSREGIQIRGTQPLAAIQARLRSLGHSSESAVQLWCAPRRAFLDQLLLDAAGESGVEILLGCRVEGLLFEGGRVAGVRGRLKSGAGLLARAGVVIGADGRRSFVADAVRATARDVRREGTFAYYTYFSGVRQHSHLRFRGRLGVSSYPTNDGLQHVLCFGPIAWAGDFRRSIERHYHRILAFCAPDLSALIAESGRREERFAGAIDQVAFFHEPYGPGWALVGDAGCTVDQCTAIGMMHALRDAQLLADSLHRWLAGDAPYDEALAAFGAMRDRDTAGHYEMVAALARMRPLPEEILRLHAALVMTSNQRDVDRLLGVTGEVVRVEDFYTETNLARIIASAPDPAREFPILAAYEKTVEAYEESPFLGVGACAPCS